MTKDKGEKIMNENNVEKELALETIITTAIQIPGVKVNRDKFLAEMFDTENVAIQDVLDLGPIAAGISQERITALSNKLILKRTSQSSAASFVAGIPGGLAMAATIPADVLQFFGMALRLAQELSYLYGAEDLWQNGQIDDEKVKSSQLFKFLFWYPASVGNVCHIAKSESQDRKHVVVYPYWGDCEGYGVSVGKNF